MSRAHFAGVSVPAAVLPDLERAVAHGFRIDSSDDGKGLVIYPPDTSHRPIRWGSRRSNPSHENNLRMELRRAGLPDTDTEIDLTEGATMPRTKTASSPTSIADAVLSSPALTRISFRPGDRYEDGMKQVNDALSKAGVDEGVIALITMLHTTALEWGAMNTNVQSRWADEQVKAAEDLAAEAEARALRAERRCDQMTTERNDLAEKFKAERDRRLEEQARADALEAALAPLRKILGGGA